MSLNFDTGAEVDAEVFASVNRTNVKILTLLSLNSIHLMEMICRAEKVSAKGFPPDRNVHTCELLPGALKSLMRFEQHLMHIFGSKLTVLLSCELHAWVTSIVCVTTLRTSTRACETSACKEKEGCIKHYFMEMTPESGTRFGCRHDVINGGWDGGGTRPSLSPTMAHNAKCDVKALSVTQECLQG
ncbi:hypothetical protein F5146DRAFT_1005376 [Armillaria mellea]|nr:hypothetical protein F5146DRAFT_1005376 [Armillaria mellea]